MLASDEINQALKNFQTKQKNPVPGGSIDGNLAAASVGITSCSMPMDCGQRTGTTAGIGVILSTWNYRGLTDKVGVLPRPSRAVNTRHGSAARANLKASPPRVGHA